jgi:PadR family transcriptional regulator, regulatory protein PadR
MMSQDKLLSDSSFVVLALLAEGECHGYELRKLVHNRGFSFWTRLQRTSIYNALVKLAEQGLIAVRTESGGGPQKKIYRLTEEGRLRLEQEGLMHLSAPAHPRNEVDLGIYALPFLREDVGEALLEGLEHLQRRRTFLEERLRFCREHQLTLPALAFERPLLELEAEITWFEKVRRTWQEDPASFMSLDWQDYVYKHPG